MVEAAVEGAPTEAASSELVWTSAAASLISAVDQPPCNVSPPSKSSAAAVTVVAFKSEGPPALSPLTCGGVACIVRTGHAEPPQDNDPGAEPRSVAELASREAWTAWKPSVSCAADVAADSADVIGYPRAACRALASAQKSWPAAAAPPTPAAAPPESGLTDSANAARLPNRCACVKSGGAGSAGSRVRICLPTCPGPAVPSGPPGVP